MKWEFVGIDPNKPSKDFGRVVEAQIEADSMPEGLDIFLKSFPGAMQIAIIPAVD